MRRRDRRRFDSTRRRTTAAPAETPPGTTDDATFELLAGWGYDVRGGLLTAVPHQGFDLNGCARIGAAPTRVVEHGDVIDLGDRAFEVLHVPGHSPGSIALWDERSGVLFSGDAVYDGPLLDEIDTADIDDYVTTMRRLRTLPVEVVHGGHDSSMDRGRFHEVIDDYLRRREQVRGVPRTDSTGSVAATTSSNPI